MKMGKQQALLAALGAINTDEPPREGEFTVAEFSEEHGMPSSTASHSLLRAAKAGKLICRKAYLNGKLTNLYSLPEKPSGGKTASSRSTKK